jgi:hypothetical protein
MACCSSEWNCSTSESVRNGSHVCIHSFLRMADIMTSQNIDLSSWAVLYNYYNGKIPLLQLELCVRTLYVLQLFRHSQLYFYSCYVCFYSSVNSITPMVCAFPSVGEMRMGSRSGFIVHSSLKSIISRRRVYFIWYILLLFSSLSAVYAIYCLLWTSYSIFLLTYMFIRTKLHRYSPLVSLFTVALILVH